MKFKLSKSKIIIGLFLIIIIILLILGMKFIFIGNKNPYGDRCDDRNEFKISNKKISKIKSAFKEVDEVKSIDVYNKLCTIKIIVNLKSDVDLNIIKEKAKEVLEIFSEKELKYYDFALYVTSNNKESEVYPINVSKHNSREDFAW